jgi:protein gp37
MRASKPFWDPPAWNPIGGCSCCSPGCLHCYAQWRIPLLQSRETELYGGVIDWSPFNEPSFNGHLTVLPAAHRLWPWPLEWRGADPPVMGPGKPSIIFVCDMCDLFEEERPTPIINRVVGTVAASDHIGLILTKRARRMSDYFIAQSPSTARLWKENLWLGFSAEDQRRFNERWPHMRKLAQRGWFVFVCIAPMLGPVTLPRDFLALGDRTWVLCYGEQGPGWRYMNPDWTRAVKKQCREAGIPLFVKQMSGKRTHPYDLRIFEFPRTGRRGT